jgi:hypothetical protein
MEEDTQPSVLTRIDGANVYGRVRQAAQSSSPTVKEGSRHPVITSLTRHALLDNRATAPEESSRHFSGPVQESGDYF